jgi:hypothetical protein
MRLSRHLTRKPSAIRFLSKFGEIQARSTICMIAAAPQPR